MGGRRVKDEDRGWREKEGGGVSRVGFIEHHPTCVFVSSSSYSCCMVTFGSISKEIYFTCLLYNGILTALSCFICLG